MEHIRTGKVKKVYSVDESTLEFIFTDSISVFDKIIPSQIPKKGETLCRTAKYWFELLTSKGIKNHFKEYVPPNRMRVERFNIIRDYDKIHEDTVDYLIPLEIICRHYAAGSLMDRIKKGKITAEDVGFSKNHEVKYGEKLPCPFIECTTKLETHDRELKEKEAKHIAGLSDEDYSKIKDTILSIDKIIETEPSKRNLIHCDGKKEFGYDKHRNLVLIDTLGTPDEDRWWDSIEYSKGKVKELSKEFIRQYYRNTGYYSNLVRSREENLPEPEIPPLTQDIIEQTSKLYVDMYERITGKNFDKYE
ncbi:MAG: phosphoribosylaminoimidazolesuccinocarboxamide synthase [archaeon]|nr:phosphoribosylaminoimidazolesuccinocarboxamide synthase [archaeon]